ncbi:MAG: hypothetical protein ACFFDT_00470 [Candidatus Hodarchaeota archaeon]
MIDSSDEEIVKNVSSFYFISWLKERYEYLKRDYWIYLGIFASFFIYFVLMAGMNILSMLVYSETKFQDLTLLFLSLGIQGGF